MEMHICRRVRAFFLIPALLFAAVLEAEAASLIRFDFDDPLGQYDAAPEFLHTGVVSAAWTDDQGRLTDSGGNPARALAASGFTGGNALHLALALEPGVKLRLEQLRFDVRASASGPSAWTIAIAGVTVLSGQTSSADFTGVDALISATLLGDGAVLDILGTGATSAAGVLRLDNVELLGELVAPVPLPGPLFLVLTPLLGLGAGQLRKRYSHTAEMSGENGHSRQASSNGK